MKLSHTKKIVFCALLTALTTVSTMVIQIPSPMNGYVNVGDVFVLFSVYYLGPIGVVCAGVGSALADLFSGYAIYAPATLLIKSAMAISAYYCFTSLSKIIKSKYVSMLIGAIVAEIIMVLGYFLYACLIMGEGLSAAASIPGNLVQGLVGIAIAPILTQVLIKTTQKIKA